MRERRCKYCNCVLSIYNPGKACAVHDRIDLSKKAFEYIADLREGVINVRVR